VDVREAAFVHSYFVRVLEGSLTNEPEMNYVPWIGYLAGILTAISYFPQLKKVWVTRSAEDISMHMMLVLGAGLTLWIVFGILRGEIPIILANGVSLALALAIVGLKLKFG
jgi:MtN3 and saliva related transmembrane protein